MLVLKFLTTLWHCYKRQDFHQTNNLRELLPLLTEQDIYRHWTGNSIRKCRGMKKGHREQLQRDVTIWKK